MQDRAREFEATISCIEVFDFLICLAGNSS